MSDNISCENYGFMGLVPPGASVVRVDSHTCPSTFQSILYLWAKETNKWPETDTPTFSPQDLKEFWSSKHYLSTLQETARCN